MDYAVNPGASEGAFAREYPVSKPAEVPPKPTWTGADPRVSQSIGAYTQMDPAEKDLKESKRNQRHAYIDDTALFPGDAKEPI